MEQKKNNAIAYNNKQKIIYMRSTRNSDKRAFKAVTGVPVIRKQIYFDLYIN
jgi:hypothetical protein